MVFDLLVLFSILLKLKKNHIFTNKLYLIKDLMDESIENIFLKKDAANLWFIISKNSKNIQRHSS